MDKEIRLSRFMSLAGVASRRKCEEIILSGAVTVNNEIIIKLGTKVKGTDHVMYDGKELTLEEKVYIMLNKPRGYLCSADDPHADKTIFDLVRIPGKRIFNAGRLDLESEGLLIMTNDGDYAEKLMHPKYGTTKQYIVKTNRALSQAAIARISKGIHDDREFLKPKSIVKVKDREYKIVMTEGKKREIRRLIAATGARVTSLRRVAIGSLFLGNLAQRKWRYLSRKEIDKSLSR